MVASKPASKELGPRNRTHRNAVIRSSQLLAEISRERRALMRADAVLRCVAAALEYGDGAADEPDYADAIGAASLLISQSIERLEAHSGLPIIEAVRSEPEGAT
jgi:hypothetical protein